MIQPFFRNIQHQIIEELRTAQSEINVAVCWFTNKRLFELLCEKLSENVSVNVIILNDGVNNKPDGLPFQTLIDLGGRLYFSNGENPVHNKYCIIDDSVVISGSYNWTYFAESKNHENIVVIKDKTIALDYLYDFNRLKTECQLVSIVQDLANTEDTRLAIVEDAFTRRIGSSTKAERDENSEGDELTVKYSIGFAVAKDGQDDFLEIIPKDSRIPLEKELYYFPTDELRKWDNETVFEQEVVFINNQKSVQYQLVGTVSATIPTKFFAINKDHKLRSRLGQKIVIQIDKNGIMKVSIQFAIPNTEVTVREFDVHCLISGLSPTAQDGGETLTRRL